MISVYVRRRLLTSRGRTAVSFLAIMFTIMVTIIIGVLFGSGQQSFVGFFTERADYDMLVTAQGNGTLSRPFFNVSEAKPTVDGFPVEGSFPVIASLVATNHTPEGNFTFVPLFGVDQNYSRGQVRSLEGNYTLNATSVVLSKSAARRLGAAVGETLLFFYFEGAVDFTELNQSDFLRPEILARIRQDNFTVSGIIDVDGRFPQGANLYMVRSYDAAATMLNVTGMATHLVVLLSSSYYDFTDTTNPARRATALGSEIAAALGPRFHVEAVKATALENAVQTARATGLIANMFAIVFPAITGILVAGTLNLSVEEKARDLAIMRLIGARRRDIGRVVLMEAGILLLTGVPAGMALGLLLPPLIVETFFSSTQAILYSPSTIGTQLAISLGVTAAFLVLPLRRALATTPAQAVYQVRSQGEFRYVERRGVDVRVIIAGTVLFLSILYATFVIPYVLVFYQDEFIQFFLASTLILITALAISLLWVAPPLEEALARALKVVTSRYNALAVASIRRNIRRNASTNLIFALIVGIMLFFTSFFSGIMLFFTSFFSGIISSVEVNAEYITGSDIRILAFTSLTPDFVDTVRGTTNVSVVSPRPTTFGALATNLVTTRGATIGLIGLDSNLTQVLFKGPRDVVEGSYDTLSRLDDKSIVLSALTASDLGLHVGDLIAVQRGSHRDFFRIALLLRSLPGFTETFQDQVTFTASPGAFITMGRYFEFAERNATTVRYSDIFVKAAPGAGTERMAQDFQDLYGVFVDFTPVSKNAQVRLAREFISFITFVSEVILVFLLIIAVFSLAVNLYASVQERSFEIGVVRSLGLRRRGVTGATLLEGVAIAYTSAGLGVAVGVAVSYLVIFFFNIFSPIDLNYDLPTQVLFVLLVATGIFAALGSFFPARSVARKPIIGLMRKIE